MCGRDDGSGDVDDDDVIYDDDEFNNLFVYVIYFP